MTKIADRKKLVTLLEYWIAHNQEHSEEFQEWSEKAGAMGESEVAKSIKHSIAEMDKATKLLLQALKKLSGREG